MNRFYITLFFLVLSTASFASHIVGGEMIYEYVGPGSDANTKKYTITLRLFRDEHCSSCAQMPAVVDIGIFNNDNQQEYPGNSPYAISKSYEGDVPHNPLPSCILNPPNLEYHMALYVLTVDLPVNQNGYTAAYQTCCRVAPLKNVINNVRQGGGEGTGATYSCNIPGTAQVPDMNNNSPQFHIGVDIICHERKFKLDFSATDKDGDRLEYSFCEAYNGGNARGAEPINPTRPSYGSVSYIDPYYSARPLGPDAVIDSKTGLISGIAPTLGEYVVCVCINEYRGEKLISTHRKDFIITVENCDFPGARLLPNYITCNGFDYTFQNLNSSVLNKTYLWNFGVAGGTSTSATPTFTFPDSGVYNVKLIINPGDQCSDSTTSQIKVYPGFVPGFTYSACINDPTRFKDTTHTRYGKINSWSWNFGDSTTDADTSHLQNPSYTYPTTGVKTASLIVTNSKGCIDTSVQTIKVFPKAYAGRDTTVVINQPLQLNASGGDLYTWQPAAGLSNPDIPNPIGQYSGNYDSVRYKVIVKTFEGCVDSAFINVRIFKTVPQVFVPTAFTPNGDGRNDVFRPIAAGIKKIEFFRIYNRWGQLVFSTTQDGKGWDGRLKGQPEPSAVYVWEVKGLDYTGKIFTAKGTVTLIR